MISNANCQAEDSSEKRTNEFVFTSMQHVFVRFLEESSAWQFAFEINWPLGGLSFFDFQLFFRKCPRDGKTCEFRFISQKYVLTDAHSKPSPKI